MDRHFVTIQERLKADPALSRSPRDRELRSVTDTPAVLKKHAAQLGADTSRWTFSPATATTSTSLRRASA